VKESEREREELNVVAESPWRRRTEICPQPPPEPSLLGGTVPSPAPWPSTTSLKPVHDADTNATPLSPMRVA